MHREIYFKKINLSARMSILGPAVDHIICWQLTGGPEPGSALLVPQVHYISVWSELTSGWNVNSNLHPFPPHPCSFSRSRLGLHSLPQSCFHDATADPVGHPVLHHAAAPGSRQPGQDFFLTSHCRVDCWHHLTFSAPKHIKNIFSVPPCVACAGYQTF